MLITFSTTFQPLAVPGRVLVGEGVLTKMCRKKPKPRQFFLFNDALVYGNIVINKKKVCEIFLTLNLLNFLKSTGHPSISGTVHHQFWGYQDENLKMVSQQYRTWSDCIDAQVGQALC